MELRGVAWSGRGAIGQVDVSSGGRTWQQARLQGRVLRQPHTRFRHLWRWSGAEAQTEIMRRAVDDTGSVQRTRAALRAERGMRMGSRSCVVGLRQGCSLAGLRGVLVGSSTSLEFGAR